MKDIARTIESFSKAFSKRLQEIRTGINNGDIKDLTEAHRSLEAISVDAIAAESIKALNESHPELTDKIYKRAVSDLNKTAQLLGSKKNSEEEKSTLKMKFDSWLEAVFKLVKAGKQEEAKTIFANFLKASDEITERLVTNSTKSAKEDGDYRKLAKLLIDTFHDNEKELQSFMSFAHRVTGDQEFLTTYNILGEDNRELRSQKHDKTTNTTSTEAILYTKPAKIISNERGIVAMSINDGIQEIKITDTTTINDFHNKLFDELIAGIFTIDGELNRSALMALNTLAIDDVRKTDSGGMQANLKTNDKSRVLSLSLDRVGNVFQVRLNFNEQKTTLELSKKDSQINILRTKLSHDPLKKWKNINYLSLIDLAELRPEQFNPPEETGEHIASNIGLKYEQKQDKPLFYSSIAKVTTYERVRDLLIRKNLTYNQALVKEESKKSKESFEIFFRDNIEKLSKLTTGERKAHRIYLFITLLELLKVKRQAYTKFSRKFNLEVPKDGGYIRIKIGNSEKQKIYIGPREFEKLGMGSSELTRDKNTNGKYIRVGINTNEFHTEFDQRLEKLDIAANTKLFTLIGRGISELENIEDLFKLTDNEEQFFEVLHRKLTVAFKGDPNRLDAIMNELYAMTHSPIFIGPNKVLEKSELTVKNQNQADNRTESQISIKSDFPKPVSGIINSYSTNQASSLKLSLSDSDMQITDDNFTKFQNFQFDKIFHYNTEVERVLRFSNALKVTNKELIAGSYHGTLQTNDGRKKAYYELSPMDSDKKYKLSIRTDNTIFDYQLDINNPTHQVFLRRVSPKLKLRLDFIQSLNKIISNAKIRKILIKSENSKYTIKKEAESELIDFTIPYDSSDKDTSMLCGDNEYRTLSYLGDGNYRFRIDGEESKATLIDQKVIKASFQGQSYPYHPTILTEEDGTELLKEHNSQNSAENHEIELYGVEHKIGMNFIGDNRVVLQQLPTEEDLRIKHLVKAPIKNSSNKANEYNDFINLKSGDLITFTSDTKGENKIFTVKLP